MSSSTVKKPSARWGKKEDEVLLSMFETKKLDAKVVSMLGSEYCYIDSFWEKYDFFHDYHSLSRFRDHVKKKALIFLETGTIGRKAPLVAVPKKVQEKRCKRWRTKCPQKVLERIERASTQTMHLISIRPNMKEIQGKKKMVRCDFRLAGSTGNVYKVSLDKVPSCTCPDFEKTQDCCKHIVFILLKVVGLDIDSEFLYQKAFLSKELEQMFDILLSTNVCDVTFDDMRDLVNKLENTKFEPTVLDEGEGYKYNNISAITGQSLTRDSSTYRPFHQQRCSFGYHS